MGSGSEIAGGMVIVAFVGRAHGPRRDVAGAGA
jgi:hypothetical protein